MNIDDNNWSRRHEVLYMAKLGFLYHRKRERFFDVCDKVTKSLTVVFGASLLAAEFRTITPLIGLSVSAISLLALVFGYTDKKQRHKELADAHMELQSKIEATGRTNFTEQDTNAWHSELAKLNIKEPPTLGTLVVICQNEIAIAEGKRGSVVPISSFKMLFANWHDFKEAT
jgi:hypothetical protein